MDPAEPYVRQDSLDNILDLLKENRQLVRDQVDEVERKVDALRVVVDAGFREVKARQDIANGRVSKAETAIGEILTNGCHQRNSHVQTMTTLAQAGALDGVQLANPKAWTRTKQVGVGGGLVGLGVIAPYLLDAAKWALEHLTIR